MSFVVLVVSFAVSALGAGGTALVCFLAFQRRRQLPKAALVLPWLIIAAGLMVAVGGTLGILSTFGAIGGESADPSQKARILAEGISGSINFAAIGVLIWFPSTIALAALIAVSRKPEA